MFTKDHIEILTKTPAGIDLKLRVKTKQEVLSKSQAFWSQTVYSPVST